MKKIAIFVEGQTEQSFVEELLRHVIGARRLFIDTSKAHGGKNYPRQFSQIRATDPGTSAEFYAQIVDSSCDASVIEDIVKKYAELENRGFSQVIGIRDLYPKSRSDESAVFARMRSLIPKGTMPVDIVLTVMEFETWFIAEYNHFDNFHAGLSLQAVISTLNYDPRTHDVTTIPHPSLELKKAYGIVKMPYNKSSKVVQRTIQSISYAHVYLDLPSRVPSVKQFVDTIDRFLTPPSAP